MAHKVPTETIVFAVSFLLIGAEFVFMGESDDRVSYVPPIAVEAPAGEAALSDEEMARLGPQPEFVENEDDLIDDGEAEDDGFGGDDFDMSFGQPIDNTEPLVDGDPDLDGPLGTSPEVSDTFDSSYGMPLAPEPMIDD